MKFLTSYFVVLFVLKLTKNAIFNVPSFSNFLTGNCPIKIICSPPYLLTRDVANVIVAAPPDNSQCDNYK